MNQNIVSVFTLLNLLITKYKLDRLKKFQA